MIAPQTIYIKSDSNTLTLKETVKLKEGIKYVYVYSESISKKGLTLEMDEQTLTKLIKVNT